MSCSSQWRVSISTEINASAAQCSTGALLRMLRHGRSQPYREEGVLHHARRSTSAERFLKGLPVKVFIVFLAYMRRV